MKNQGVEIGITTYPVVGKKINWSLGFIFAHNKNEIIKLYQGEDIISANTILREGEDFQSFLYKQRPWQGNRPWVKHNAYDH